MTTLLIVDDHPMVQLGLTYQIQKATPDYQLLLAATFNEMISSLKDTAVDLIILDLGIPGGLGVAMITEIRRIQQGAKILIYTSRDELTNGPVYLQAGANGFLHKVAPQPEINTAIKAILNGKKYVSMTLQTHLLNGYTNNKPSNNYDALSPREKDILHYLMEGSAMKEIGARLKITQSTVSTYKERIMEKMQASNMVELYKKMHWYIE
jgi:DNA-binding NarL/FixJ family response regulator